MKTFYEMVLRSVYLIFKCELLRDSSLALKIRSGNQNYKSDSRKKMCSVLLLSSSHEDLMSTNQLNINKTVVFFQIVDT